VILYLHGFRSSPLSIKAQLLAQRLRELGKEDAYCCPQLPASPKKAAQEIAALVEKHQPEDLTVIGSSLGGYYATWLAEESGCRAVLLNPAVHPQRDLARHLGPQTVYYSGETVHIEAGFLEEFDALWKEGLTRSERYFLIAAKGDEVLDWREMVERYRGAQQLVIEGSDHGISDFPKYIDRVLEFAGISTDSLPVHNPLSDSSGAPESIDFDHYPASVRKVALALLALGVKPEIVLTSDSARTAQEAAAALGVDVGEIAKSLVFRTRETSRAVLVVAAGDHRVDERKVGALLGEKIERADAQFVRAATGFAIGGVAPIGHAGNLIVLCDASLTRFPKVWAAAGSPHAVFPITPSELFRITQARVADVKQS
jgi:predicted esterase YcpF (UPF0227 family)/prolyl-tRNA editing enzyme YbaK/EbsC (Cys-tRNA(Pro) deacylase)